VPARVAPRPPGSPRCSWPPPPPASSSHDTPTHRDVSHHCTDVALVLTLGCSARLVLLHLFTLRDALSLLDYDDDRSIFDFKMLLLRCGSGGKREAQ
jgi:hypothetical protein